MRIAYLANTAIPSRAANSIQVMKMCQAFSRTGHEVTLLTPDYPSSDIDAVDPYSFYGVDRSFEIHRLPGPESKYAFCRRHATLLKVVLYYSSTVRRRIERIDPDVVFARCHSLKYPLGSLGVPIVLDAHKLVTNDRRRLAQLARSRFFRRLVVTCDAMRQAYEDQQNIPGSLITVARNGADESVPTGNLVLGAHDRLQVCYTGHLYSGRGMEMIWKLVVACPWADFHVIGGTDQDVERWRLRLGDTGNVFFHGFVPPSRIAQYHRLADVLIAPYQHSVGVSGNGTQSAKCMSPLKIFEYMSSGKPILASDLPAIREVLSHGTTAWLASPTKYESWEEGLRHLRDHSELRARIGAAAKREFCAKYTWQARATRVLDNLT